MLKAGARGPSPHARPAARRRGAPRLGGALAAASIAAALAFARPALACPDCAPGREARAQAWQDDFGFNLSVALLPFVLIGAVSAWANGIGQPPALRARPFAPLPGAGAAGARGGGTA
ncbi:MAG TPA: hypothetical protein VFS43_33640 [Polyangiaceae bacterium]|nr:hypothetical protein [Polyangiaceae bacterium]